MVSVALDGAAERIAARTLFNVVRAGCGTPARYSSTVAGFFGVPRFAAEACLPDFDFFMSGFYSEFHALGIGKSKTIIFLTGSK